MKDWRFRTEEVLRGAGDVQWTVVEMVTARMYAPMRCGNRAGRASVARWPPFDYSPDEAIETWRGEPGT